MMRELDFQIRGSPVFIHDPISGVTDGKTTYIHNGSQCLAPDGKWVQFTGPDSIARFTTDWEAEEFARRVYLSEQKIDSDDAAGEAPKQDWKAKDKLPFTIGGVTCFVSNDHPQKKWFITDECAGSRKFLMEDGKFDRAGVWSYVKAFDRAQDAVDFAYKFADPEDEDESESDEDEFSEGDEVLCVGEFEGVDIDGLRAVIVEVDEGGDGEAHHYFVKFTEKDMSEHCGSDNSWWVHAENLQHVTSQGEQRTMNKKFKAKDVNVQRSKGVKTIEIGDLPIEEAITWLQRKKEDENKEVAVNYTIDGFPLDVAVNFYDALLDEYGFVQKVDTPGFWGPEPPMMISVPTGPSSQREVPWGRIKIPGVSGFVEFSLAIGCKLAIIGKMKQRDVAKIEHVVSVTKSRIKTHSIYKGKAVELDLCWTRNSDAPGYKRFHPLEHAPKFTIDTANVDKSRLILSKQVQEDINVGLFTPLEYPELCAAAGVPVKRGVLLSGEFGTGKTMAACVAAKIAEANGMGFILLRHSKDLAACFEMARLYQEPHGVVVFCEDINKAIVDDGDDENDSDAINTLQNAFDGVSSKTDKIITVLTTNFLDKVPQSLLRPGRIDLLVQLTRPDGEAAARLVQQYGADLLSDEIDWKEVAKAVENHLPAEIREIVERSKMSCISRLCLEKPGVILGKKSLEGQVTEHDIVQAARQMDLQHNMLKPKEIDNRSDAEKAAAVIGRALESGIKLITGSAVIHDDSDLDNPAIDDEPQFEFGRLGSRL